MEYYPCLVLYKPLKSENNVLKKISVTSPEFTVGRSLNNSAVIPLLSISRHHCKITNLGNEWIIYDLSTGGIQVNGDKLGKGKTRKLEDGDLIGMEPSQELIYKFILQESDPECPRKKVKCEPSIDPELINSMTIKFDQSQDYEVKNLQAKIQNAKQKQNANILLKEQLQSNMMKKMNQVEENYASQIVNLKGEKLEIEMQKVQLEHEKNYQLDKLKTDMGGKIAELMEQIKKHNEVESDLLMENNYLKEKLLKERREFMSELSKESSSKQDLLNRLDDKVKEQEEKLQEKQQLEQTLRTETELLRQAKEKELTELAAAKSKREEELMKELNRIRKSLEKQITRTEQEKQRSKQQLNKKIEEMKRVNDEDKVKVEELTKENEEMQKLLIEAPQKSQKYIEELKARVAEREVELARLAAERIQQQADQSSEVIKSLQKQLEKVKNQLQNTKNEKKTLENCAPTPTVDDSTSKTVALIEFGEIMESELQCSICSELFIAATTLNCSHTFCKYCITMWKKKKNNCPVCRAPIASECKSLVLDSFIEKAVQNLTQEMKDKRREILKRREESEAQLAQQLLEENTGRRSLLHEESESESDIILIDDDDEEAEEDYPLFEEADLEYDTFGEEFEVYEPYEPY